MITKAEVKDFEPVIVEGQTDTALILYSSGTTGLPKGVPLTQYSCILNSMPIEFGDESLKTLLYGDWYHKYDIFKSFAVICAGKKIVYSDAEISYLPDLVLKIIDDCQENYITGEQLTYAEFIEYSVCLSAGLSKLGVKKGDIVAVGSEKRITFLPTTLAVVLTGAAYTPYDLGTGRALLRHELNLAKPNSLICSALFWEAYSDIIKECEFIKTIIYFEDHEEYTDLSVKKLISNNVDIEAFEPADVEGETDIALILYSSGTTGLSKGVLVSHLSCVLGSLPIKFQDESLRTVVTCGDWCHRYDMFTCYAVFCAGRKIVFAEKLTHGSTELFPKIIQDCKVNIAIVVPSMVSYLANAEEVDKYDLSSLNVIFSAALPLHTKVVKKVKARIPSLQNVLQIYGMTEAGEITTESWGTKGLKARSVGMACPGITLKVVDPKTRETLSSHQRGEICVHGPLVMKGYIGMESSAYLDKEGFLLTGDLGYYDEDKYIYIVGRLKEMLCFDGFTVPPLELEAVLLSHPDVSQAAVVGKPAGVFGEQPAAFVVRQPGSTLTEQQLRDYVALEVPPYMQLRGGVEFVPQLPRDSRGKIIRRQLQELL